MLSNMDEDCQFLIPQQETRWKPLTGYKNRGWKICTGNSVHLAPDNFTFNQVNDLFGYICRPVTDPSQGAVTEDRD